MIAALHNYTLCVVLNNFDKQCQNLLHSRIVNFGLNFDVSS